MALPKMNINLTSNSSNGITVTASSNETGGGTDIYKALNGSNSDVNDCWVTTSSDQNKWYQIDFGKRVAVDKIVYASRNYNYSGTAIQSPKSVIIYGSDDGVNWYNIYEKQDIPDLINGNKDTWQFNQIYMYRYFKLQFSTTRTYVSIGELEIYGTYKSSLIKLSNDKIISLNTTPTDTVLKILNNYTENSFANHGFYNIDLSKEISKIQYINNHSEVFSNGKIFEHIIDLSKHKVNKIIL